jgi:hypothetical protein
MAGVDQFLSVAPTAFRAPLAKTCSSWHQAAVDMPHDVGEERRFKGCSTVVRRFVFFRLQRCFDIFWELRKSWALFPHSYVCSFKHASYLLVLDVAFVFQSLGLS